MTHPDSSFRFWQAVLIRDRPRWENVGVPLLIALLGALLVAVIHYLTGYYLSMIVLVCCSMIALYSGFTVSILFAVGLSLYGDYFYLKPIGRVFDSAHAFEHSIIIVSLTIFVCFMGNSIRRAFTQLEKARKEAEGKHSAELAQKQAEVETKALERVLSLVSHDLLNPLSMISLQAQLLQMVPDDQQKQSALAKKIEDSVHKSISLVRTLLDVSRIRAGRALPLNFDQGDLGDLLRFAMQAYEADPRIDFVPVARCLLGKWSRDGIARALDNLVSNALKYGDAGSKVTITLQEDGGNALISVHNMGNEMSAEERARIFSGFYRTPSAESRGIGGWGLGLVLVKAVAVAHGGEVKVESVAGNGTTFTLCLPLLANADGSAFSQAGSDQAPKLETHDQEMTA